MPTVVLHNISDRPNTPGEPVSIVIGGTKLRPGRSMIVDSAVLNQKHRDLHGTRLWIGKTLPGSLTSTSKTALKAAEKSSEKKSPLSLQEARAYLATLSDDKLRALALSATPPVPLRSTLSRGAVVSRLGRALFSGGRELDPEAFFWLGRWLRVPGGFLPVE